MLSDLETVQEPQYSTGGESERDGDRERVIAKREEERERGRKRERLLRKREK